LATTSSHRWHALPLKEVLSALGATDSGLSREEAAKRLDIYGPNQLRQVRRISPRKLFLDEFRSPLVIILILASALLFTVAVVGKEPDQMIDAVLILLIVFGNAILGFVQNYRAQRGIESLKHLSAPKATVRRDGRIVTRDASHLVPGDVVLLEEGNRIPADGRLLEAYDLWVDESLLTGESMVVGKATLILPLDTNLAERGNLVFSGTTVMLGRGHFVVTATAMATEMGKIAEQVQRVEERPTPFQQEAQKLGKRLMVAIGFLILVIAAVQLTVGHLTWLQMFVATWPWL